MYCRLVETIMKFCRRVSAPRDPLTQVGVWASEQSSTVLPRVKVRSTQSSSQSPLHVCSRRPSSHAQQLRHTDKSASVLLSVINGRDHCATAATNTKLTLSFPLICVLVFIKISKQKTKHYYSIVCKIV